MKPTRKELADTLADLVEMAVNDGRIGNPYCIPEVKAALRLLDREAGFDGNWGEGLRRYREQTNPPPIEAQSPFCACCLCGFKDGAHDWRCPES